MSSSEKESDHESVHSSIPTSPLNSTPASTPASSGASSVVSSPAASTDASPPRKQRRLSEVSSPADVHLDDEAERIAGTNPTDELISSTGYCDIDDSHQEQEERSSSVISSSSSYTSACSESSLSENADNGDSNLSDSENESDTSRDVSIVDSGSDNEEIAHKLYHGSLKTTDEAVLALMKLYVARRWDKRTLTDMLSFCGEFFPSNLPNSVYKIFKYVEDLTPSNYQEIKHYYCSDCLIPKVLPGDECEKCGISDFGVFFELPLSTQLKHFFEYRNLASLIDRHNAQATGDSYISDICSGSKYKEIRETLKGDYDVILSFFVDGVSLVGSSDAHLYPILATICNVHPEYRYSFMLICGIWYDPKSVPIMNNYLSPFVHSVMQLSEEGVHWTHPQTNRQMRSFVVAPLLIADGVARADILKQQQCTSKYACNTCEQKAVQVNATVESGRGTVAPLRKLRKLRRFVYQEEPARLRSQERIEDQAKKAEQEGRPVRGITGSAVVSRIPHFNRSTSAPPEYMHCILLGVVKRLITLWFSITGEWNISGKLDDIDAFIQKNVKVTDDFTRVPRGVRKRSFWKASEYRMWLLFISLPALAAVLPEKYFQHYMLLVGAMYLLLQEKISLHEVNIAEIQIRLFVRDLGMLYRQMDYVYNTHSMLHLCQYTKWWGNPWATSAFKYEGFNFVLANLAHGTKHKGQEIVNRIRLAHGVQILQSKVECVEAHNPKPDSVLGLPVNLTSELEGFDVPNPSETYLRASYKKNVFSSKFYDENKRRANSYVQFQTTEGSIAYGQIRCFYVIGCEILAVVKVFKVQHDKVFFHNDGKFKINHLIPVIETDTLVSVALNSLKIKLARVGNYFCIRPNNFEVNV